MILDVLEIREMPEKWKLSTGKVATLARNGCQLSNGTVAVLLRIMR